MKTCYNCGEEKPLTDFYRNKSRSDGRNAQCKVCHNEYRKKHYAKNRAEYLESARARKRRLHQMVSAYKSERGCSRCGYNEHPVALDLHHVDAEDKEYNVGQMVFQGMAEETILEEMAKCEVVCSNCHRILHATE